MPILTFMSNHGFLTGFLGTLFFLLILSIALLISMHFEKKLKLKYDYLSDIDRRDKILNLEIKNDEIENLDINIVNPDSNLSN